MTDLNRDQRRALETAIKAARDEAEAAAADALRKLGVADAEAPAHLDAAKRAQRNRLRAHARALGDGRAANGTQAITRLTEQAAYVQWHRLLFARFLIERKLLREETGAAVSLNDCREIAFGEGAGADEWSVAAGFAAAMLPGVFPADDPVESLVLAPEHARTLRQRLLGIHPAIFMADDSLGWTYQFWRAAEKKAVNEAQVKIGAAELPAVTQLFTEPYMVRFLLHNTLGAWWAGKRLAAEPALARGAADEAALRTACALPGYAWEYLRFVQEDGTWRPAGGTFPGWPVEAKALTVLDPCCGSGHFLTEALAALAALRGAEEGVPPGAAVAAVLRDNLAGLEIDGRCVQIAAFNLALTGWQIGGAAAALPTPNVAWVGAPPPLPKAEFAALANGDADLRRGLEALYDLFRQAPLLGSLIEPVGGDLVDPRRVARIEGSIAALVERMRGAEPERAEGVVAARGMADAAAILSRRWVLLATNVPFRASGTLTDELKETIAAKFEAGKRNLATAMVLRLMRACNDGGALACVTPREWLSSKSYRPLREQIARTRALTLSTALGPGAFHTITGEVVNVALVVIAPNNRAQGDFFADIDASPGEDPREKATIIRDGYVGKSPYKSVMLRKNLEFADVALGSDSLGAYVDNHQGLATGDLNRFSVCFWEIDSDDRWIYWQGSVDSSAIYAGCERVLLWENGAGSLHAFNEENKKVRKNTHLRGSHALGKAGVLVTQMGDLPATIYSGCRFDDTTTVLIPKDANDLAAIWCYISSEEYNADVRSIDSSIKVPAATLSKPAFNLAEWKVIAEERYPSGIPEPHSDDPTQWLFHGHPRYAAPGTELHVALARLAGYRWPAETDTSMCLSTEARARIAEAATLPLADADGLLPLSPLLGERGLADRLRSGCASAWGEAWTADTEAALISAACERANDRPPRSLTLDAWLRTHAARQHAKLFHDRPFLWWITDGRVDGFMAVVHYHRLTRDALSRLAFHVLGDHLARLGEDARVEAARILQKKLEQIIEGEAPFDIFVRWKPLHEQSLGWDPDLDDGVRLNIRPFVEAEVLAHVPNVKYGVDRGKDVASAPWYGVFNGERRNDHHTTLAEKRAARAAADARAARTTKR
jgi:hypothetical protein